MNVSCPECRSVFRVDPSKVPTVGVRARCSVCGGVITMAPPAAAVAEQEGRRTSMPATAVRPMAPVPEPSTMPRVSGGMAQPAMRLGAAAPPSAAEPAFEAPAPPPRDGYAASHHAAVAAADAGRCDAAAAPSGRARALHAGAVRHAYPYAVRGARGARGACTRACRASGPPGSAARGVRSAVGRAWPATDDGDAADGDAADGRAAYGHAASDGAVARTGGASRLRATDAPGRRTAASGGADTDDAVAGGAADRARRSGSGYGEDPARPSGSRTCGNTDRDASRHQPVPQQRSEPEGQAPRPGAGVRHGGVPAAEAGRGAGQRYSQGDLPRGDQEELRGVLRPGRQGVCRDHEPLSRSAERHSGWREEDFLKRDNRETTERQQRDNRETTERQQRENRETTVQPRVGALLFLCCFSVVSLLFLCCFSVVSLLFLCCFSVVSLLFVCCLSVVCLLRY
ncbi:MAG: hypothetical protein C0497_07830 [Gemmatimonas sp.]|nr:hypothetical protein [Gemmatimonas sp.]